MYWPPISHTRSGNLPSAMGISFEMSGNANNQDLAHDVLQIQEVQRKRRRQQTTQVENIRAGHFFVAERKSMW
jgi:hypothetical protein